MVCLGSSARLDLKRGLEVGVPSKPPFGFNVAGCASGNFGEALVLRNTIRVLLDGGYPVAIRNFETGDSRSGQDSTYETLYIRSRRGQPYSVNLFGFNPPTFDHLVERDWLTIPFERRFNVMLPAWELDVLPPAWIRVFQAMDVVLASSSFVADTIRRAIPDLPLLRVYTAVYLPDGIEADRARWGVGEDEVVFFSAFDVTSDMRRKNPWAAIKAFQSAFPLLDESGSEAGTGEATCASVRLLVKLSNVGVDQEYGHLVDELAAIASANKRITLIDEQLSYDEALSLYASSDVFVSLHRAEGLGLVLMEAMSLGKPVIATAYSGSMDFTTAENSALVDFELVPVDGLHHDYQDEQTGGGARWAEPSISCAADWMVRLAQDAGLRARLGEKAALDMESRRQAHMAGEAFGQLREFAETHDLDGEEHRRKAQRIRDMRWEAVRRLAPRLLRIALGRTRQVASDVRAKLGLSRKMT
jgi:glycosyltransferase involved in cell wall biosynthesis